MNTREKPLYKQALFWILVVALIAVMGLFVLVDYLSGNLFAVNAPTEPSAQAETEAVTLPTLPPPEANPYDSWDFSLGEDGYMTCLSGESMLGIDVSYVQNQRQEDQSIDWQQVKDAGIEFVIIRVAGRGYGEAGKLYFDDYWRTNYEGARAVGLKVGVYFFSQAITVEEAVEEAEYLLEQLDGRTLEMPVVYDWEYIDPATADDIPRTVAMSKRMLTDCTKAFCDTVREAGYEPMIYFNADQSHKKMYMEELTDYAFWLASYTDSLSYPYKIDMWQYTDTGSVPGIDGDVDINLYLKYE